MEKNLFDDLENKRKKIAVIGLGYVGIPLLINLSKHFNTIGFDTNEDKINSLNNKINLDDVVEKCELERLNCLISSDESILKEAYFFIIAVPTPVDNYNNPDLAQIENATKIVGRNISKNSIIVYESTVYPGLTEEICIPILEKESNLLNKRDFIIGYSPERINPGDKINTFENVIKIISAQDESTLNIIDKVYKKILKSGTYRAESIKVAEAAKVIENTQRDLNIALINELSIIFHRLGLNTNEVLSAAKTKWNFLDFSPGLVGGHCIGVDPYYLTHKAKESGYHPEVILSGRKINDNMGFFIGDQILRKILNSNKLNGEIKVVLFGISYKENIKDIRNTKVVDIYNHLTQYGINVQVYDPIVNREEVKKHYDIRLVSFDNINEVDAIVICVPHDCFKDIDLNILKLKLKKSNPYIFDIKGLFKKEAINKIGINYWRL